MARQAAIEPHERAAALSRALALAGRGQPTHHIVQLYAILKAQGIELLVSCGARVAMRVLGNRRHAVRTRLAMCNLL